MRFLLGVLIGTVATLCVATVFDGPTRALVSHGVSWAESGSSAWNRFFLATGKAVFPATEGTPALSVEVPFQAATPALAEIIIRPDADADVEADADVDADAGRAVLLADTTEELVTDGSSALEPLIELPSPDRVATHEELRPTQSGTEVVWVPFRSQMSAKGFAARLTQETQHPFDVTRNGPGKYQVNFAYSNEAEREQLAQRIRLVTGEAAP